MFLKVCGITRDADAALAARHGATALGFVFWPRSPRAVTAETAAAIVAGLPSSVTPVGVFVNASEETVRTTAARVGLRLIQLHGDEDAGYGLRLGLPVLKATTLESCDAVCRQWPEDVPLLLDAADPVRRGGTGRIVDWEAAAALATRRRIVLAGGLTPGNVAEAIVRVRPYGVDVSSGLESAPGIKDPDSVVAFLASARAAFAQR